MAISLVYARAKVGIDAPLVRVEVHLSPGLPAMHIVGLPEAAVKEAKDRVRSALLNSFFEFPKKRITINLAPADLPKEGGRFDLAIALGILAASEQFPAHSLQHYEFVGELALSGEVRPVLGALTASMACLKQARTLVVAASNAQEANLPEAANVLAIKSLVDIVGHLQQQRPLELVCHKRELKQSHCLCFSEVKGQVLPKRALEIAACGGHDLILFGPPGSGKTLLASRLTSIMPKLSEKQALEVAAIASIAGLPVQWRQRPFRRPHHSCSAVAMVGGGAQPTPGEITLAHHGVLFLDELPEFSRQVLDMLREPLESGEVHIARAAWQATFPAQFQLIAAMNPTPLADEAAAGTNDHRYLKKLSRPLLDRMDMFVEVASLPVSSLTQVESCDSSAVIQLRTQQAWSSQMQRQGKQNAYLTHAEVESYCVLAEPEQQFMQQVFVSMQLSMRAYHRVLKLARTIADLKQQPVIGREALVEALSFRQLQQLISKM